jgi:hypothetical protein
LDSGLWVDSQLRYNRLVSSDRSMPSGAFGKAGWRTVGFNPADDHPWPEGTSFYHYARVHDRFDFGYHGPWTPLPSPTAPVWRMDASRNRFLDAFSTSPTTQALRPAR